MKLIDLLVKELPKLGGWPEGVTHIGQEYDRELMFYGRGNISTGLILNELAIDHRKLGKSGEKITRAQYEAAIAASDGWIQWAGGECPVDSDAIVEVRFSSGELGSGVARADRYIWRHEIDDANIVAYRLHNPEIKSHANDGRLEQDLNECIGHGADTACNGEGLPPVGCECEVSVDGGNTWCSYKALNEKNGMRLVEIGNFTEDFQSNNWTFRPIHSEADKKREEAINKIQSHCHVDNRAPISAGQAIALYDAIAAGKIPGVKLEGK